MTFWQFIVLVFEWISDRVTRILGVVGGTITVLLSAGVIPTNQVKWYMAAIAVLTYWRGQATANTVATAKSIVAVDNAKDLATKASGSPK